MVIAIASPSKFSLRRLARMFEHEAAHIRGLPHEEMPHALLYSLGKTPEWAYGLPLRYVGKAPRQMPYLGGTRTVSVRRTS